MRAIYTFVALGALLPVESSHFAKRVINDPVGKYLNRMCSPNYSNITRISELNLTLGTMTSSLALSPFPCEQELYIGTVCIANGTTEIDFLAEQECLCNGGFFEAITGCDACFRAHGYFLEGSTPEKEAANVASLSAAECEPSPPFQPYLNLIPSINLTSLSLRPPLTLSDDQFPNNTAVSNYFTPTRSLTPGKITGSATARLTSWTNFSGVRYTPTSIPPNSGITSTPSIATSTGRSTGKSSTATASGNVAVGNEIQAAGGLLAAILGVAVLL